MSKCNVSKTFLLPKFKRTEMRRGKIETVGIPYLTNNTSAAKNLKRSYISTYANLYSPELQKCYFLYNHKKICSKVPILLFFVRPKRPSGNCYVNCFLTEKTALNIWLNKTNPTKKTSKTIKNHQKLPKTI